jgi:hypothetical protein
MARRTNLSVLVLTCFAALLALMLLATPALAKPSHEQGKSSDKKSASDHDGDADSDSSTGYTEDNDTNDGGTPNNVSDEGDNQHPSGKDRSVEHGKSGNQGKAESNPDDSKGPRRYEGELGDDKPNGPGGTDVADQDGNNGCGNDDDFDDDNNGWCGKHKDKTPPEQPCDRDETMPGTQPCDYDDDEVGGTPPVCDVNPDMPGTQPCGGDDVGGDVVTTPPSNDDDVEGGSVSVPAGDEVLGGRINPDAPETAPSTTTTGAALPFTGAGSAITYLLIGFVLLLIGGASVVYAKK